MQPHSYIRSLFVFVGRAKRGMSNIVFFCYSSPSHNATGHSFSLLRAISRITHPSFSPPAKGEIERGLLSFSIRNTPPHPPLGRGGKSYAPSCVKHHLSVTTLHFSTSFLHTNVIVPDSSVRKISTPYARNRSVTSGAGCP